MAGIDALGNPSVVPIPDPSVITALEIAKAKSELRDEFRASLQAVRELLETARESRFNLLVARLDGMDKATYLLDGDRPSRTHDSIARPPEWNGCSRSG